MKTLLTRKTLLLGLLIYGLVFMGLFTLNGTFITLAIPLLVYLTVGLLREPHRIQLTADRTISADRVLPDELVTITLTITNHGPSLDEVRLMDLVAGSLEIVEGEADLLTSLPTGEAVELTYTVLAKRGLYRFTELYLTARDHFGLFERSTYLAAEGQFLVMPALARIKHINIRPRRTGVYVGQIPTQRGGPGIEFFGLRDYRPGDPIRWLNERASARHAPKLFVNEFQQERMADIGLILDAREQSDAHAHGQSLFEYSIQAVATLADTFINGGNRVGLFIYGHTLNWTMPGYGKIQRERIMQALAQAKQGHGSVFEKLTYLPTRLFPPQSQLVMVSPLLPPDPEMLISIRARRYELLVISPDPVSFELQGLSELDAAEPVNLATKLARLERHLILAKLRQARIQVVDWQVEQPFYHVAQAVLNRGR